MEPQGDSKFYYEWAKWKEAWSRMGIASSMNGESGKGHEAA